MSRSQIAVQGIDTACCAENIETALAILPGVRSAQVSFDARQAIVDYDEQQIQPQRIVQILEGSGFSARLVS